LVGIEESCPEKGKEREMMLNTLVETRHMISIGGIIVIFVFVSIFVLLIIGLIRLVRYLGSVGKEQKLMRMEMGKLAEEVHLFRRELEKEKDSDLAVH